MNNIMSLDEQPLNQQYVVFKLSGETMGIPIHLVREVIGLRSFKLTRIPGAPKQFLGVINLRGQVIPIVDARLKFNFSGKDILDDQVKAIIVERERDHYGLMVDEVEDVLLISSKNIENTPSHLSAIGKDRKIARIFGKDKNEADRFVFLLSQETLFGYKETTVKNSNSAIDMS